MENETGIWAAPQVPRKAVAIVGLEVMHIAALQEVGNLSLCLVMLFKVQMFRLALFPSALPHPFSLQFPHARSCSPEV